MKLILSFILISSFSWAGAWMSPKGKGTAILQYRHQERLEDNMNEMSLYAEYGFLEKMTAGVIADYSFNNVSNLVGLTESQGLFVRPLLFQTDRTATSIQFTAGSATRGDIAAGYGEIRLLQGFSGQIKLPYFLNFELAQKNYGADFDSETKFEATVGFKLEKNREVYLQNFNTWAKSYTSHEVQGLFLSPVKADSAHKVYGGMSVPWGSRGIESGLIFVLGYRYDF